MLASGALTGTLNRAYPQTVVFPLFSIREQTTLRSVRCLPLSGASHRSEVSPVITKAEFGQLCEALGAAVVAIWPSTGLLVAMTRIEHST